MTATTADEEQQKEKEKKKKKQMQVRAGTQNKTRWVRHTKQNDMKLK